MAGSWSVMLKIGLMLALNNLCYVSIGSVLGVVVDKIPKGMIISTIVAQSSLVGECIRLRCFNCTSLRLNNLVAN